MLSLSTQIQQKMFQILVVFLKQEVQVIFSLQQKNKIYQTQKQQMEIWQLEDIVLQHFLGIWKTNKFLR